ncbi:hypothetical protein K458DRAFT_307340 [Lentithecium fluviatile CBS 122367]|uniref:U6 snRNA phosphodiesterase n=1 Tax=Lentithecium fluviatile CBS 122367 TaxID=1168545 RepID=A0A6G1IW34_9PLEO|nr:hypothetical protein K458DRAFT_307340 [Lentithecium fluviatile CBS 122367]
MSLVLYPDSESDEDDATGLLAAQASASTAKPALKRKRSDADQQSKSELPPLPAAFHDLYSTNARVSTSDDPSLHGGRKRAVPHVEGNWPSHVYLEWLPSQTESQDLYRLIEDVQATIERANNTRRKPLPVPDITPSLWSPLGAALPLHVSLSRTLQIKTNDRDAFLDSLKSSLWKAAVRSFHVHFSKLKWVPNFERNRWFLVLGIEKPVQDELNRLLDACNEAAWKCGHPGLYIGGIGDGPMEGNTSSTIARKRTKSSQRGTGNKTTRPDPVDRTDIFHVSIAWNLLEPDPEWLSLVRNIDVAGYAGLATTSFDVVKAKIGNVVNNIDLGNRQSALGTKGGVLGL